MDFQLQNVEIEVDTEQGCISAVRKYLAEVGFNIPMDKSISIRGWVPTRKTRRFWIEFAVEKDAAEIMEMQRRMNGDLLKKWNEKTFGNQIDLYLALKSVQNYVSEPSTSSQPADSTSEVRVKAEPIDSDDPPNVVKTEITETVPMDTESDSEEPSATSQAEYQENEESEWAYQEPDRSEILKTFPFLFRIECLPLEFGMMQESAVTQFLTKIGLPANVSFGIFSFVEHPSTSESKSSPRFDVEIAVGAGVKEILQSSSVRLALLLLNEQKSLKETSEYITLLPIATPRERAIQEVLVGVCGILNSGKTPEEFLAVAKVKTIVVNQFEKPPKELTIDDVFKCYRDEYMEIVTNCSEEVYNEMKTWLEEEEVAHSLQNEEERPEPRILPETHVEGAMEIMNNVCTELNRGKIKSEYHAVARQNIIMVYEPKKPTVKVRVENVAKQFPKEYHAAMKIYNAEDVLKMRKLWREAPSVIWKADLAKRNPLQHALNEMMAGMCTLLNVGKVKTEWNAYFNRGQIHVARFRRKTKSYTLEEAFREMPDFYRGARKTCNEAVLRELSKWEAAKGFVVKRTAEQTNEGPVVKMPR